MRFLPSDNSELCDERTHSVGALVTRVQQARLFVIIEQLTGYTSSKDEQLRDIANLGAKRLLAFCCLFLAHAQA